MRFGNIVRVKDEDEINLSLELFADSGNTIELYECNIQSDGDTLYLLINDSMDVLIDKTFKSIAGAERYAMSFLNNIKNRL